MLICKSSDAADSSSGVLALWALNVSDLGRALDVLLSAPAPVLVEIKLDPGVVEEPTIEAVATGPRFSNGGIVDERTGSK